MTSIQRAARESWFLVLVIALTFVAIGIGIGTFVKEGSDTSRLANDNKDSISCVESWANALSARTDRLLMLNDVRNRALRARRDADAKVLVVALTGNRDRILAALRAFKRADAVYKRADATYTRGLARNPPPPAPKFLCADQDRPRPSPSRPPTIPPSARRSTTPARPTPALSIGPPAATHRARAAPSATVTTVRTRTATTTATRTATTTRTATATRTTTAPALPPLPIPIPTSVCRPIHLC